MEKYYIHSSVGGDKEICKAMVIFYAARCAYVTVRFL